jgi:hypothetical protein
MYGELSLSSILDRIARVLDAQEDKRRAASCVDEIRDAGLAAFSVFFTQSASFLGHQRDWQRRKGKSNANSVFSLKKIPTDPQIRNLLDEVEADDLARVYRHLVQSLAEAKVLEQFKVAGRYYLLAMDGTQYFSSEKIHCQSCSSRISKGQLRYSHSVIPVVLVSPEQSEVISLEPEFILPQDGGQKQDCERKAAKRWLKHKAQHYPLDKVVVLGDDLYCCQSHCEAVQARGWNFIFVCKPDSHQTLYEYLNLQPIQSFEKPHWNGTFTEIHRYRFATELPLRDSTDALSVNWCELSIFREADQSLLYRNSFATDLPLNQDNAIHVVAWGRSRWKTENENNNILKTKGYNFEHNFGHGKKHLSTVLLSLLLLAFLSHTVFALTDKLYQRLRQELGTRKTFFNDIRALLRYQPFPSWQHLLLFMAEGLEFGFDSS